MQLTKNFNLSEFACNDGAVVPLKLIENVKLLAHQLQVLRDYYDAPIKINSAYRSPAYNKGKGVSKSKHMTGQAIDVRVTGDYDTRASFVVAASRAGFTGIGIYSTFIHLDTAGRGAWVAGESSTPSDYPVPSSQVDRFVQLSYRHDADKLRTV